MFRLLDGKGFYFRKREERRREDEIINHRLGVNHVNIVRSSPGLLYPRGFVVKYFRMAHHNPKAITISQGSGDCSKAAE